MVLLIYFILFFLIIRKGKSVALLLTILQIISLGGIFFIGKDLPTDSIFKVFNILFTGVILTLIISPWRKIVKIDEIYFVNGIKLKKLTRFLLLISAIPFFVLLLTTVLVYILVDDINTFKYAEGVSTDFFYNLPFINVKALILSTYLYYFGYFLIPLHFYYLAKRNYKLSILCLIFSLNIVLYGLTYFSRAVVVQYILLYTSILIILYNTLGKEIKKLIKKTILILGILFSIYFAYVTHDRFSKDSVYANLIPSKAIIQDPVLYSYFDYLSQWYYNSNYVLNSYDSKIFNGQISLQPILSLMGQYGIINYKTDEYKTLRRKLWPLNYYTFNGFVAYSVYDFGYLLTLFFSCVYYFIVKKLKPIDGRISLARLFPLVLLIQLPLMAIFYSTVSGIIIPLILLIPIFLYLKTTIIIKKTVLSKDIEI